MAEDTVFWDSPEDNEEVAPGVSSAEIRRWEESHGVRLPRRLAAALSAQDGGRVRGQPELRINGLEGIERLDGDEWEHLYEEGDEGEFPANQRDRLFAFGDQYGCELVLDYRGRDEPGILVVEHGMGGRLAGIGVASFDALIEPPGGEADRA